jgi:lactate racemase
MKYLDGKAIIEDQRLSRFIRESLKDLPPAKKILVLFPDYTRIDFSHMIAPSIAERYQDSRIDFLNAGGTHRPMMQEEFVKKLDLVPFRNIKFLNHSFSDPSCLATTGKIDSCLVKEKTEGMLASEIKITVNKLIFSDYDLIIALSGTVPHEAAGYSGGLKIFFPGISGPEVIDAFHWAAVLVGIPKILGTVDNNGRDIINAGARAIFSNIKCPIYSYNMVNIESRSGAVPTGLYIDKDYDGFISAYRKAAGASSKVHIKYLESPLSQVVQEIPSNYDEIWLAGKGSYKLQKPGVLKKGAEVIIYAPHIKCFHTNPDIEEDLFSLGYHCRDHICSLMKNAANISRNAASHLINVCGPGIFDPETRKEDLAFKVTLATSIPEDKCKKVGLGYRNPSTIIKNDFNSPGKLWIEEGGKYLYELKK